MANLSNYLEQKFRNKEVKTSNELFKRAKKAIRIDQSIVDKFSKDVSSLIEKTIKKNFGGSTRVYGHSKGISISKNGNYQTAVHRPTLSNRGLDTRKLFKSIKVETTVNKRISNDSMLFDIEFKVNYLKYGGYIARGRKAAYIPIKPLFGWIKRKYSRLNFKQVDSHKKRIGGIINKNSVLKIAFMISNKANKRPKPAVIKDWDDYRKNSKTFEYVNKEKKRLFRNFRVNVRRDMIKRMKNR